MAFIPVIRGGAVDFLVDFFMQRWQKEQMLHVKKTVTRTDTNLKIHKYLLDDCLCLWSWVPQNDFGCELHCFLNFCYAKIPEIKL